MAQPEVGPKVKKMKWIHVLAGSMSPSHVRSGTLKRSRWAKQQSQGENRVEAEYRTAENNKAGVASAIEVRLEVIFQNAEGGTAIDSTQVRYIGAEASKLPTSSMKIHQRFREEIATTRDDGQRVTQYRVFTQLSMPESDFKLDLINAAQAREGGHGVSAEFAKKVDEHWNAFIREEESP